MQAIAVFNSNHDTLQAEKTFKQHQIPTRPIIKPRKISSSCTLALEFDWEHSQKIIEICTENKLSLIGIFQKQKEGWKKLV